MSNESYISYEGDESVPETRSMGLADEVWRHPLPVTDPNLDPFADQEKTDDHDILLFSRQGRAN